jgi:hypothetical protein
VRPVLELRLRSFLNFFRRSAGLGALVLLFGLAVASRGQTCTGLCLQQVTCIGSATTSLTGTVYAPNGTDPVPNVLVYVPNGGPGPSYGVQPFAPGVSVPQVSGSPLVSATTASDGTFTLTNMPVGSNIPLVVQIGKWRRQVVIPNVAQCVTTTATASLTRLPRSRAEGDVPKTAIVTGAVDAEECTLRKIGIADTEFTDPAPYSASPGRVNLYLSSAPYQGGDGPGAQIDAATPTEQDLLWASASTLNSYDVLVLANPGEANPTATVTNQQKLVNFANAGGRVLAEHFNYNWLYNIAPFSSTAHWAPSSNQFASDPQTGLVNGSFTRGQQMAQWLKLVGASTTQGQIQLAGLRNDVASVTSPSTTFLSVGDANLGNVPLQFSFDTPVGTAPGQQTGRVLFSDFVNVAGTGIPATPYSGMTFPNECAPGAMTAQEKLFEYNLFDVTGFLSPPLPAPTASVNVSHSPSTFVPGDSGDSITISVVTTGSTPVSAGFSVTPSLPAGLTPISVSSLGTGSWSCTLSPLSCSLQKALSGINAEFLVTVSVANNATGPLAVSATASGGGLANSATGTDSVPVTQTQTITFTTGAPSVAVFGNSFTVAAIASSGLPITYSSSGSCTNSGATYSMTSGTGVCTVIASQPGNSSYSAAQGTQTAVASPAPSVVVAGSTLNPAVSGQPVALVAVVLPQPSAAQVTGVITFKDGATVLGTAALNSFENASITVSNLAVGSHSITASYGGDTNESGGVSSILAQTVLKSSVGGAPPFGFIEKAADARTGSTTVARADNLLVSGWAADLHDGSPVSTVQIFIDGTLAGNATLGISRPDLVFTQHSTIYLHAGWTFLYPASKLSLGTHTITALATDSLRYAAGLSTFVPRTITVIQK